MPKMISDLPAATVINDEDVFAVEQAGVSKKISWASLRDAVAFEIGTPKKHDLLVSNGFGFSGGSQPRWRVVNPLAYVWITSNNQQIAFSGAALISGVRGRASDYFQKGDPVRIKVGGVYYYCICDTATTLTLKLLGPPIPTLTTIQSVEVGSKDMIRVVSLRFDGTGYNTHASNPLTRGCRHRWIGKTGHLALVALAHMNTSATVTIQVSLSSGTNAFTSAVQMFAGTSTTYGGWREGQEGVVHMSSDLARVRCQHNDVITVTTPIFTGLADWPIFNMFFVVP